MITSWLRKMDNCFMSTLAISWEISNTNSESKGSESGWWIFIFNSLDQNGLIKWNRSIFLRVKSSCALICQNCLTTFRLILYQDFVEVIKADIGIEGNFERFRELCEKAFLTIRNHGSLIISLLAMMISTGLPELSSEQVIADWIEKVFKIKVKAYPSYWNT